LNSRDELVLLKRHASVFFDEAEHLFNKGEYDVAAFNAEQAAQFFSKAALLEKTGDFPRSHTVIDLISRLGETTNLMISSRNFLKKNRESLKLLETAYLTSRYLPISFTREDA
jgi:HEPN domain-containing protein